MACRIDLFAADTGAVGAPAGFASANDGDEERLAALLAEIAGRTALEAATHGQGRVPAADVATLVRELTEVVAEATDDLERNWADALRAAAASIARRDQPAAWLTRFDTGGSTDDGPDEFVTAWGVGGDLDAS
jgi:hypothetical protein